MQTSLSDVRAEAASAAEAQCAQHAARVVAERKVEAAAAVVKQHATRLAQQESKVSSGNECQCVLGTVDQMEERSQDCHEAFVVCKVCASKVCRGFAHKS